MDICNGVIAFVSRSVMVMSLTISLVACHESLEERAEREAREYTEKYCPTPPQNEAITDSIVFCRDNSTYTTYLTLTGSIDNKEAIEQRREQIVDGLLRNLRANASFQAYKTAGFSFAYVCRSESTGEVLVNAKFTEKDYQ